MARLEKRGLDYFSSSEDVFAKKMCNYDGLMDGLYAIAAHRQEGLHTIFILSLYADGLLAWNNHQRRAARTQSATCMLRQCTLRYVPLELFAISLFVVNMPFWGTGQTLIAHLVSG